MKRHFKGVVPDCDWWYEFPPYESEISPVDELPGVNRGNKHADEEAQPKADPRADQGSSQAVPPSDAQGS